MTDSKKILRYQHDYNKQADFITLLISSALTIFIFMISIQLSPRVVSILSGIFYLGLFLAFIKRDYLSDRYWSLLVDYRTDINKESWNKIKSFWEKYPKPKFYFVLLYYGYFNFGIRGLVMLIPYIFLLFASFFVLS